MLTQKNDVPEGAAVERLPKLAVKLKINDNTYTLAPAPEKPGAFSVSRPARPGEGPSPVSYEVRLYKGSNRVSCTCPDARKRKARCKHLFAVLRLCCVFAYAAAGKECPPADRLFPAEEGRQQTFVVVAPGGTGDDEDGLPNYEDSHVDEEQKEMAAG